MSLWQQCQGELQIKPIKGELLRLVESQEQIATLGYVDTLEEQALLSFQAMPYTQLANVTGVPAMSVPLHWCDNGLPMGVQFVGTHGDEGKLLSLAAQLEQAQPWQHRVAML